MTAADYKVIVDWDNNEVYEGIGIGDAIEIMPTLDRGVDIQMGRDTPRRFSPVRAGDAAWTADNSDGRFTDATGAIGADLVPNRPIRVYVNRPDGLGGSDWVVLFTGQVDRWKIKLDQYPLITADFQAVDALGRLASTVIATELYSGLRTDQAVGKVLDAVGWYPALRDLDTGYTTLGYWWASNVTALEALQTLADHEQGFLFVDHEGKVRFESRYNRVDRGTVDWAFQEGGDIPPRALEYLTDQRDVVNRVTVSCRTWMPDPDPGDPLWVADGDVVLGANESRTFYINLDTPAWAFSFLTEGLDYFVTAGSLVNVPALSVMSGASTSFVMTAGASGATISALIVRGTLLVEAGTMTWVAEDSASQDTYGLRTLDLTLDHLSQTLVGRDAAQAILYRYKDPRTSLKVTFRASTLDYSPKLLAACDIHLSDRVSVDVPAVGVSVEGFVESLRHTIQGLAHDVEFVMEEVGPEGVLTLDDDVYGLLDEDNNGLGW